MMMTETLVTKSTNKNLNGFIYLPTLLVRFVQFIGRQLLSYRLCCFLGFLVVTTLARTKPGLRIKHQYFEHEVVRNEDLVAVIHIGPMKTGSSAIQTSLGSVYTELTTIDHYEDAGLAMDKGIETYHMVGCFRPDAVPYTGKPAFEISCHPNALEQVSKIATERNNNLIVTAEYLTDPKTNLTQLKEFLSPWKHHRIVAYYRRYYDWLISFHNQVMKEKSHIKERQTIVEFLTMESKNHFFWEFMYLQKAIARYEPYFTKDNIHVINTYNQTNHDARPAFYCEGLINATAACSAMQELVLDENNDGNHGYGANPSVPLIYTEMAYYAKVELRLWGDANDENDHANSVKDMAVRIQKYHEQTLHRKRYEFANETKVCPEQNVLNWLLETSLHVEKNIFPDYYHVKGHDEIIQHFHESILTKMCHTDVSRIFQLHPEYISFIYHQNDAIAKQGGFLLRPEQQDNQADYIRTSRNKGV